MKYWIAQSAWRWLLAGLDAIHPIVRLVCTIIASLNTENALQTAHHAMRIGPRMLTSRNCCPSGRPPLETGKIKIDDGLGRRSQRTPTRTRMRNRMSTLPSHLNRRNQRRRKGRKRQVEKRAWTSMKRRMKLKLHHRQNRPKSAGDGVDL